MKLFFEREIVYRFLVLIVVLLPYCISAQNSESKSDLDLKVEKFLEKHEYRWHDMNIPTGDGEILYDIIRDNNN